MKKVVLILSVLGLTGCSTLIDSFLMKYDTNEYKIISQIRTEAELSKTSCANEDEAKVKAEHLARQTIFFKNYVQYLPRNDKVISASKELDQIAQGLTAQYQKGKVSPAFCKIKFQSIENSAESMQKIIGDKPR